MKPWFWIVLGAGVVNLLLKVWWDVRTKRTARNWPPSPLTMLGSEEEAHDVAARRAFDHDRPACVQRVAEGVWRLDWFEPAGAKR